MQASRRLSLKLLKSSTTPLSLSRWADASRSFSFLSHSSHGGSTVTEGADRDGFGGVQPYHKGLLLDAAGTLLSPSEPAAEVYLRYAKAYGCSLTEQQILSQFRRAYNRPWSHTSRRYVGDARVFWSYIVAESTGCEHEELAEEIWQYFARPAAWTIAPQAILSLHRIRDAGVKTAVVSNFDTRLRPLLAALHVDSLFDAIIVSAEVGAEKPNPVIFEAACSQLGLDPSDTVHVGDDRRNDLFGARDAGCYAWLWGLDVTSMNEVADRVIHGNEEDQQMLAMVS